MTDQSSNPLLEDLRVLEYAIKRCHLLMAVVSFNQFLIDIVTYSLLTLYNASDVINLKEVLCLRLRRLFDQIDNFKLVVTVFVSVVRCLGSPRITTSGRLGLLRFPPSRGEAEERWPFQPLSTRWLARFISSSCATTPIDCKIQFHRFAASILFYRVIEKPKDRCNRIL